MSTPLALSTNRPPLHPSIAAAIVSLIPAALVFALVVAEYALLLPTMIYLRSSSLGS